MFLGTWAERTPDKAAIICSSTGEVVTYRDLNDRSLRLARYLHDQGLRRHDRIALYMENNPRFLEVVWAALRSGLELVPVNRFAVLDEVAYILDDCGAKAFVTSHARADVAAGVPASVPGCRHFLMCDGTVAGYQSYEDALAQSEAVPIEPEWAGSLMPYTSGTTGRPKGVCRTQPPEALISQPWAVTTVFEQAYDFDQDMVYLSTAPLYHGAPIRFARAVQSVGGTVVVMEKFDERQALELIERYGVTHSQWVPTMFIRMLRLPETVRAGVDLSTHRFAVHAAAPCPIDVKRAMIDWWGPIIHEYYGATDGAADTHITSEEWLLHPGSVGRPAPGMQVCDPDGDPVAPGERGLIYAPAHGSIWYLNDPAKTASAKNPRNTDLWTVGDIGYVEDGYLYLSGRQGFMIISGGVNIYPEAIESAIAQCDLVQDVAVVGVPNPVMGEEVKAVVQPAAGVAANPQTAEAILGFISGKLAAYMFPKSIDFVDSLPRLPTGKLYKQALIDKYRDHGA